MKHKFFTVNDMGEVVPVSPFARGLSSPEVEAPTKSAASALLLRRYKAMLSHAPRLVIRDGAFLLITHNGETFVAESGTLDRANSPLCLAHYPTLSEALADKSFAYYASSEYRNA